MEAYVSTQPIESSGDGVGEGSPADDALLSVAAGRYDVERTPLTDGEVGAIAVTASGGLITGGSITMGTTIYSDGVTDGTPLAAVETADPASALVANGEFGPLRLEEGNLRVVQPAVISAGNSFTNQIIVGGATLTGTYESVLKYATISILGDTDNDVTVYAVFSKDGLNSLRSIPMSGGNSSIGLHNLITVAEYFRLDIEAGPAGATVNVEVIYHANARIAMPTSRYTQAITPYTDALNTRTVQATYESVTNKGTVNLDSYLGTPVWDSGTLTENTDSFIGEAELNPSSDVMVTVKSDQNGILYTQFSVDGVNWDTTLTFKYDTTRINPPHVLVKGARYFRVLFQNTSSSSTTVFRVNTYYGSFQKLTAPINGLLAQTYDALVVRPTDFFMEAAEGKRQGVNEIHVFGQNPAIGQSYELLSEISTSSYLPLTAVEAWEVVSDSTDDAAGGPGALMVRIEGIALVAGVYESVTEDVTLTGVAAVATDEKNWIGVNSFEVISTGSTASNLGNITLRVSGGAVRSVISAGEGVAHTAALTTTSTQNAFLKSFRIVGVKDGGGGSGSSVFINVKLYKYIATMGGSGVRSVVFQDTFIAGQTNPVLTFQIPYKFPPNTQIWVEGSATASASLGVILDFVKIEI